MSKQIKYSNEFKLKVVKEYLEGKSGYKYLRKKYNMTDTKSIRVWVNKYINFGEKRFLNSSNNTEYTV